MAGPIETWRDVAASAETAAEFSRRPGAGGQGGPGRGAALVTRPRWREGLSAAGMAATAAMVAAAVNTAALLLLRAVTR